MCAWGTSPCRSITGGSHNVFRCCSHLHGLLSTNTNEVLCGPRSPQARVCSPGTARPRAVRTEPETQRSSHRTAPTARSCTEQLHPSAQLRERPSPRNILQPSAPTAALHRCLLQCPRLSPACSQHKAALGPRTQRSRNPTEPAGD